MDQLFEKREKRELQILSLLYSEEHWWSTEELANAADCSIESANKAVLSLKEVTADFGNAFTITIQKNKGVLLHVISNTSISSIEALYIRNTTSYQIIDGIFQTPHLTIEKLMDELYLSKSTIYRKLKSIEYVLQQNKIDLDKNSLKLTGSEINIREFFYVFYWSSTRTGAWPFRMAKKDILELRLKEALSQAEIGLSPIEELQVYYRMAINFIQHQKKQFVTELPTNVSVDPVRLAILEPFATVLSANVPKKYYNDEFSYLGLILSTYPYLREKASDELLEIIVNWYQQTESETYILTKKLLAKLSEIYTDPSAIKQLNQPKVLFMIFSAANYALLFPNLFVQEELMESWHKQTALYKQQSPCFFKHLQKIIYQLHDSTEYRGKLMDPFHSLYAIYSIFRQNINLKDFEHLISIKLICSADPISEKTLSQHLQSLVSHNLLIKTSTTRNDQDNPYDLIISDLQIAEIRYPNSRQQFLWGFPPSARDWKNLNILLNNIAIVGDTH